MSARLMLVVVLAALALPSYAGTAAAADRTLPPVGTHFDYQLGGNRSVPDHVGIVVRDRTAEPLEGVYNICYVNGFQTQPDQKKFWRDKHWDLVLKDDDGDPVVDENWGEWLLDIRTDAKRTALARIMGRWITRCADDGYLGVEFDNLETFSRSHGLISKDDTKQYAVKLTRRSHRAGLAAGQKNWSTWDGTKAGYDFVIAEECARWKECGEYVDHYGRHVLAVEYRRKDFRRACANWSDEISIVRRDLDLSADGVRTWC